MRSGCNYQRKIELKVIDPGISAPEKNRNRLRERFARSCEVKGADLGLSVVKNRIDKYQGALSFEDSLTQKLTVQIKLPMLSIK